MRRFTVSLPDDLYTRLRKRGEDATPPATLQQMVRHAVESLTAETAPSTETQAQVDSEVPDAPIRTSIDPVDLLVFAVGAVTYAIPVEIVETVAAGLDVHKVPTASTSLVGMVGFRDDLTEVHDGGTVLQGSPLPEDQTGAMLAVPRGSSRVLLTVTSVAGLTAAGASEWSPPPPSAPAWVSALAWTDEQVVAVIDPRLLDL